MLNRLKLLDPIEAATDFSTVLFGLFTLLFWVAFLLETSFAATNIIALAAFVTAIVSVVAATRPVSSALDDWGENRWPPSKLILIAAAAGLGASTNLIDDVTLYWLVLVAAAAMLVVGLRSDFRPGERQERRGGKGPLWPIAALCIAAAAIVLVSHRPDADDEFYLRIALAFLERPNASLADIGIIQSAYGLASYYGFAAWFSRLTGLPLLDIYYLIFPPIAAVLSVMANYRLFRELTARPIVATAVVIAVYLLWADMHTAPGNFAYVRLFQGKAAFTIVVVPMVLTYAIRIFRHRGWRTPLLLTCAVAGGIGLTQSAIIILAIFLLLALPLLFAGSWRCIIDGSLPFMSARAVSGWPRIFFADCLRLLPICIPFLLVVAVVMTVNQMPEATPGNDIGRAAVYIAVGEDVRAYLGFAAVFILPAIAPRDLRFPLAMYLLLFGLIVFNPAMQDLLNYINSSSIWRLIWIFPVVPATAIVIVWIAETVSVGRSWVFGGMLLALLVGYAMAGPNVFTRTPDPARIGFPQLKIPDQDRMRIRNVAYGDEFPIIDRRICLTPDKCY